MNPFSRRAMLVRLPLGVAGAVLIPTLFSGCAAGGGMRLRLPSGREVSSGEVVASGVAYQGETPAQLYLRVTTNASGDAMEIQRLRGLVSWRVVTDAGAMLATGDSADAPNAGAELPTQYSLDEGTVVEFAVVRLMDAFPVTDGDTVDSLREAGPAATELVVLRDHVVVATDAAYTAQDGDFAVFVDPRDEESLVA